MWNRAIKNRLIWLTVLVLLTIGLNVLMAFPEWIEGNYSRRFYPIFSYLPKFLFSWIPFSLGDLFYAGIVVFLLMLLWKGIVRLFKKQFSESLKCLLSLLVGLLGLYVFFNISWGLNYYRIPVSKQMGIAVDTVRLEDHIAVLEDHIEKANLLRNGLDWRGQDKSKINQDIEVLMQDDVVFPMLSHTQIKIKNPLFHSFASYMGVSGYFNPFTHEAHINGAMPMAGYPFTVSHELAHQMGIGFEDECNFIAYVKLKDHENPFYSYAAYFESVRYLLNSLYLVDKGLFEKYKERLSEKVLADLKEEQEYWKRYTGWISDVSGLFYDQYLKHNNQAEGMARYGMVSRLIINSASLQGVNPSLRGDYPSLRGTKQSFD